MSSTVDIQQWEPIQQVWSADYTFEHDPGRHPDAPYAAHPRNGRAHPASVGPSGRRQPRCRSDSLDLGPLPGSVPSARLHVRAILQEWGLGHLANDTESVTSELITNGVQATLAAGVDTPVRLTLTADGASVLVVVWDAVLASPVAEEPDLESEHGRGLLIVEALAEWWDCRPVPAAHGGGKLVRAMIADTRRSPR